MPTKVCLVKTTAFPVVMYGCHSWTIKKVECQRIDAFELCCWRRLLSPLTARRSNQSILKEISPEYSLERMMPKLKCQYFGHLMWRTDSLEKTVMLGKIEGRRRKGWQNMRWLDGITDSMDISVSNFVNWSWTGRPGVLQSWGYKQSDMTEQVNWTEEQQPGILWSCVTQDFMLLITFFYIFPTSLLNFLLLSLFCYQLRCEMQNEVFQPYKTSKNSFFSLYIYIFEIWKKWIPWHP